MIRTFLFDMGNVLVHFSHELMCEQMGMLCGQSGREIHRFLLESGLLRSFECGTLSEEEFHQRFEAEVGQSVDFDQLRLAGSDIFQLNEPLIPLLRTLKARGHRLVLLSNTSVAHFVWVRDRFDVLELFDDQVLSYEVGAVKPDPQMYLAALQRIECAPQECFYADDIAENVEAGRGFGLQAEVFTDAQTLSRQLLERGVDVAVQQGVSKPLSP